MGGKISEDTTEMTDGKKRFSLERVRKGVGNIGNKMGEIKDNTGSLINDLSEFRNVLVLGITAGASALGVGVAIIAYNPGIWSYAIISGVLTPYAVAAFIAEQRGILRSRPKKYQQQEPEKTIPALIDCIEKQRNHQKNKVWRQDPGLKEVLRAAAKNDEKKPEKTKVS